MAEKLNLNKTIEATSSFFMNKEIFVFDHVEKCGGVSLAVYFLNQVKPDHKVILAFPGTLDLFYRRLRSGYYDNLERIFIYTHFPCRVNDYFPGRTIRSVTLLREPWARFVSAYHFSQDISFFPDLSFEKFFKGGWHNFMTLTLGEGDLSRAKERLEHEYSFVGITEEFEKSMQLMAHVLDFSEVNIIHANRSSKRGADIPADFKDHFYEKNRDDVELYSFARSLFQKRWHEAGAGLNAAGPPQHRDGTGLQGAIAKLTENFKFEKQKKDSFLFKQYNKDDRLLHDIWGILYRLIPLAQMWELMGQSRFSDLGRMIDNLEAYHRDCPFPNQRIPEIVDYFRKLNPRGLEAVIAAVMNRLGIDLSGAREQRLGPRMPYGLLNFMDFVDTKTMLSLFKNLEEDIDIEGEMEKFLD